MRNTGKNRMEAVIDTNVLIYEFIEDSEYHNDVKRY